MLKELLLLPTEVGGIRLNRDGGEVFTYSSEILGGENTVVPQPQY
jgi:hypothetical protein